MHHWNKHGWPLNNRDLNCPGPVIHEVFSIVNATVVQSLSRVWLLETTWTAACQASLSFTIFRNLFKLMSIELMMSLSHLILCRSILLLPSVFFFFFNFKICNSYRRSQTWTPLPPPSPKHLSGSILRRSAFFIVQLSYPYMITGKTTALTRWTFLAK